MAFNVRLFGYRGMRQLPHLAQHQFTSDTVYSLDEPYEWSQVININGLVMTPAFTSVPGDLSKILLIEVPNGSAIRYEINPPGRNNGNGVQAGSQSKMSAGTDVFPWSLGYSVSIVDAANYP